MRQGQLLYTYFHFASSEELTRACLERQVVALAYETVQEADGSLPLLKPMSEVAGRMAGLMGSYYLGRAHGGRGVLASGVPGVAPCNVLILGGASWGATPPGSPQASGPGSPSWISRLSHARVDLRPGPGEATPTNPVLEGLRNGAPRAFAGTSKNSA